MCPLGPGIWRVFLALKHKFHGGQSPHPTPSQLCHAAGPWPSGAQRNQLVDDKKMVTTITYVRQ